MFGLIQLISNFLFSINTPYTSDIYGVSDNDNEENTAVIITIPKLYKEKVQLKLEEYLIKHNKQFEELDNKTKLTDEEKNSIEELKNKDKENYIKNANNIILELCKLSTDKLKEYENEVLEEKTALITNKRHFAISLAVKKKELLKIFESIKLQKSNIENYKDATTETTLKVLKMRLTESFYLMEYVQRVGNIIFHYNKENDIFCYYSDYNITTNILDSILKKYCLKTKIKELFETEELKDNIIKPCNKYLYLGKIVNFKILKQPPKTATNKKMEISWNDWKNNVIRH